MIVLKILVVFYGIFESKRGALQFCFCVTRLKMAETVKACSKNKCIF